jgi:hypothetical protein
VRLLPDCVVCVHQGFGYGRPQWVAKIAGRCDESRSAAPLGPEFPTRWGRLPPRADRPLPAWPCVASVSVKGTHGARISDH